jgi:hypothetical protein
MDNAMRLEAVKDEALLKQTLNKANKLFLVTGRNSKSGELSNGLLAPTDQEIVVDDGHGNPQAGTEGVIPGIKSIKLRSDSGWFFDFTLNLIGGCPKGEWNIKLQFTEESGDTYVLRIFREKVGPHYLNYHSPKGCITSNKWDI